jgi:hypothetical protein
VLTIKDTKYGENMTFYFVTEAQDIPSNSVMITALERMWKEAVTAQSEVGTEANHETGG